MTETKKNREGPKRTERIIIALFCLPLPEVSSLDFNIMIRALLATVVLSNLPFERGSLFLQQLPVPYANLRSSKIATAQ